jgi:hypothetical protein
MAPYTPSVPNSGWHIDAIVISLTRHAPCPTLPEPYYAKRRNCRPASTRPRLEKLVASLDKPDPMLDALWLKEAENHMTAYRADRLTQ